MTLEGCIVLAAALLAIGVYGLLTRKQAIALLLSVELMANSANILFAAFGHFRASAGAHVLVLFALALTVAEVAVGLAIVLVLYRRHQDTALELAREARE